MSKPPAFQFYAKDFLDGTATLSNEEVGAYIRLLAWSWGNGPLPADEVKIARLIHSSVTVFRRVWTELSPKWTITETGWVNDRLERQRAELEAFKVVASIRGKAGAGRKWGLTSDLDRQNKRTRSERLAAARALGTHTELEWQEMLAAFGECLKCGETNDLVKDHIVPIYAGGSDSITNIQPLCRRCNAAKGPNQTDHRIGRPQMRSEWLLERLAKRLLDDRRTPGSSISALRSSDSKEIPPKGRGDLRAPATNEPVWRPRNAQTSAITDSHFECYKPASAACAVGLCVPPKLWREWVLQCGDGAEDYIRAFVTAVANERPKAGDRFKFWRERWDAAHTTQTPKQRVDGLTAMEERLKAKGYA